MKTIVLREFDGNSSLSAADDDDDDDNDNDNDNDNGSQTIDTNAAATATADATDATDTSSTTTKKFQKMIESTNQLQFRECKINFINKNKNKRRRDNDSYTESVVDNVRTDEYSTDRETMHWKIVHQYNGNSDDDNNNDDNVVQNGKNGGRRYHFKACIAIKDELIYKVKSIVKALFLPIGYPKSVNDGYIEYQFYDSIQGLCSYLRGVVSTSAVLSAAGVGDSEATAMSAAVHWATKDGCGMIGGLLFSYYSSSYFDSHIKEFRLFADIINDVGLTLDMIAPHVPKSFLLYVSILATICRSLCGIAAGATKGSITEHFSKHNMADLNAKEGTQETLVSLIGMLVGIMLARMIQRMEQQCNILKGKSLYEYSAIIATWYIFITLTVIHVWSNYIGVKTLKLRTLNRQRCEAILANVIHKSVLVVKEDLIKAKSDKIALTMRLIEFFGNETLIPSPAMCNESILKSFKSLLFPSQIQLGVQLSACLKACNSKDIQYLFGTLFQNEKYFIIVNGIAKIQVVLHINASQGDELKAFLHTLILRDVINQNLYSDKIHLITRTKNYVDIMFSTKTLTLDKIVASGWDNKLLLDFGAWRSSWSIE